MGKVNNSKLLPFRVDRFLLNYFIVNKINAITIYRIFVHFFLVVGYYFYRLIVTGCAFHRQTDGSGQVVKLDCGGVWEELSKSRASCSISEIGATCQVMSFYIFVLNVD